MDTPTSLPAQFAAGTTVKYTRSLDDFRAIDGWSLSLVLAGATHFEFPATVNGNGLDFDFLLPFHATPPAPSTDQLAAGIYTAAEYATKGSERYLAGGPWRVEVLPDLVAATGSSQQLWLERIVAALQARIEGRLQPGSDLARVEVEGRAVELIPILGKEGAAALLDVYNARLRSILYSGAIAVPVEVQFE